MSQAQTQTREVPSDFGDSLLTVRQFVERYPHLYPHQHRVRWLARDRHRNGLIEYGAVLEVYGSGDKAQILIHVPSWFAWLRAGGSRAPKPNPKKQLRRAEEQGR